MLLAVLRGGEGKAAISALGGLGGVGKTELAVHVAHKLAPDYPEAQIVVDLMGTSESPLSPEAAMGQVVSAFHPEARWPPGVSASARMAVGAAHARAEAGRSEDAAALLRRALARDAGSAVTWIELGLLEDASARLDAATRAYRRARAADSNNAWAHGCLAWAGLRAGRPLQALYHSARALRLDSRYADALTIAALAADRIGLHRWAGAALEKAIGMAPRRGWPYFERVRQLAAEGRLDEGRKLLGRYRRLVPDDAAAAELLQSLSRGRGNES